jgi:hypothetical protein
MKLSKIFSTLLLITIFIVPSTLANARTIQTQKSLAPTMNLSTWLWNTSEIVTNSDNIINFLVKNKVTVLYLQIDYNLNYTYYKNFISKATKNNIRVEALEGSPDWLSTTGINLQNTFFNCLTSYQKNSSLNEQFKGVHLDVEPYSNSEYSTNQNKIINNYQTFLLSSKNICKKLNLNFGIDIPFWFNEVNYNTVYGNGNLAEWIFINVKTVSIMAYRDFASGANGINEIAKAEMDLCKKYNVQATIAVETGDLPETPFVTFFEEGQAYMSNQLNSVYLNYKTNSAFRGFAIHHLDSWMNMKI